MKTSISEPISDSFRRSGWSRRDPLSDDWSQRVDMGQDHSNRILSPKMFYLQCSFYTTQLTPNSTVGSPKGDSMNWRFRRPGVVWQINDIIGKVFFRVKVTESGPNNVSRASKSQCVVRWIYVCKCSVRPKKPLYPHRVSYPWATHPRLYCYDSLNVCSNT